MFCCCCCLVIYNFEIFQIIFCSSLLLTCMKSMFHSCSYLVCAHLLMTSFFYFKMPQINLISCLVASIIFSPTSILYALASFAQINWLQQALITEYRYCGKLESWRHQSDAHKSLQSQWAEAGLHLFMEQWEEQLSPSFSMALFHMNIKKSMCISTIYKFIVKQLFYFFTYTAYFLHHFLAKMWVHRALKRRAT